MSPKPLGIDDLVRYYDEGWRYGHIVEITKKHIRVKPIGAIGSNRDAIRCTHDNVELAV